MIVYVIVHDCGLNGPVVESEAFYYEEDAEAEKRRLNEGENQGTGWSGCEVYQVVVV